MTVHRSDRPRPGYRTSPVGERVDRHVELGFVVEKVTNRAATATEAESLAVQSGSPILEIERTHFRGERAL
jgi:DNA-binding GntR family transcriptional regulator